MVSLCRTIPIIRAAVFAAEMADK